MTAQVNVTNLLDTTYYTDAVYFMPFTPGVTAGAHTYGAPFSIIGSLKAQIPAKAPAVIAGSSPPPVAAPLFTWTGPYVGAQIGYAWGEHSGDLAFATPGGLVATEGFTGAAQGVIGGAHAGYNYQVDQWVLGFEGAVDGANLNKHPLVTYADPLGTGFGATADGVVQSGIQGSIRGRAGYAFDRLLIYGTAGVAFGDFKSALNFAGLDATGVFYAADSRSSLRVGWTVGAGVQYAVNNNWSVDCEYRYSDFGHLQNSPEFPFPELSYDASRHLNQNQVQVGFSYKFDGFAPAPVVAKY